MTQRYRVLDPVGLDYPTPETRKFPKDQRVMKRAVTGKIVEDLPEGSIPWLLAQGYIEPVKGSGTGTAEPATDPPVLNTSAIVAGPEED